MLIDLRQPYSVFTQHKFCDLLSATRWHVGVSTTLVMPAKQGHVVREAHFHWFLLVTSYNCGVIYEKIQGTRSCDQIGAFSLVLTLNISTETQQNKVNLSLLKCCAQQTFYIVTWVICWSNVCAQQVTQQVLCKMHLNEARLCHTQNAARFYAGLQFCCIQFLQSQLPGTGILHHHTISATPQP